MIGPCMPHQSPDVAPELREAVAQLACFRQRKAARVITAESPGWLAWYSARLNQWLAHRSGNWSTADANFGSGGEECQRRLFAVSATSPGGLRAAINWQALLDLFADHPDWRIIYLDNGEWRATLRGRGDGSVLAQITAPTPVRLAAKVRACAASADDAAPFWAWW